MEIAHYKPHYQNGSSTYCGAIKAIGFLAASNFVFQ